MAEQLARTVDRHADRGGKPGERCRMVFSLRVGEGARIGAHVVEVTRVGHRPEIAVCGPVTNDVFELYPDWEKNIDDAVVRVLFTAPASLKIGVRGKLHESRVRGIYRPQAAGSSDAGDEARDDDATPPADEL